MPKRRSLTDGLLLSLGLALAAPSAAHADSCTVRATPVAFGTFRARPLAATGTVTLTCRGGGAVNPFAIALNAGSGTFANRTMKQGANVLRYNLYTDVAHTGIWGDGTAGTSTVKGNVNLIGGGSRTLNVTVYGLIPAQGLPSGGAYSDTIVVTVTF